jgi:sugar phosphate isomerase/epimerase
LTQNITAKKKTIQMKKNKLVSRRSFMLQSTSLLSAALLADNIFANTSFAKYKMGLQLFSIRAPLAKDLSGTIKKIASVGYEDCETYGYDPSQGKYYGLKASAFKQLLADNNMITTSGHYDFTTYFDKPTAAIMQYVDQCIEGAHALGQKYITWPWLDPAFRTLENFRLLTGKLNMIGERVAKAGLGFAYHNHDFEFSDYNGETAYDIIMKETDPALVKLQMDIYWVMHSSKRSPSQLFDLQPGRFVMWHIKDMDKINRDYSELGNGSIDFTAILPKASQAGLKYYYIEQGGNFAKDPIQSVIDSAAYFKQHLEKYLG